MNRSSCSREKKLCSDYPAVTKGFVARKHTYRRVSHGCRRMSGRLQDSLELCVIVREFVVVDCAVDVQLHM